MDELTVFEVLELIRTNEEAIATNFQVWLSITFATIVAVFAGKDLLTRSNKWLVTMLYFLASLASAASSIYLAESNAQLTAVLADRGVHFPAPVFAGTAFLVLFFAGVCTTIYFVHMSVRDKVTGGDEHITK